MAVEDASFDGIHLLGLAVTTLELLLHWLSLTTALLNTTVICRSLLLHPNLKWILAIQSVSIAAYELGRLVVVKIKFIVADVFTSTIPLWLQNQQASAMSIIILIGHVILAERVAATAWPKAYGNFNRPYLAFAALIVAAVSALNSLLNTKSWNITLGTFIFVFAMLGLCLAEIFIFTFLGPLNRKRYFTNTGQSLSEKFQISENIRTNRQLAPTFIFHFLILAIASPVTVLVYFNMIATANIISLMFMIESCLITLCNLGIEITVITHHPILKRSALKLLKKVFCWKSSQIFTSSDDHVAANRQAATLSIDGGQMITSNEHAQEIHFKALQRAWNIHTA